MKSIGYKIFIVVKPGRMNTKFSIFTLNKIYKSDRIEEFEDDSLMTRNISDLSTQENTILL